MKNISLIATFVCNKFLIVYTLSHSTCCVILFCNKCPCSGQRDHEGHKAAGSCQAPPHDVHHHPQPPAYVSRRRRQFRVGPSFINDAHNFKSFFILSQIPLKQPRTENNTKSPENSMRRRQQTDFISVKNAFVM